MFSGSTTSVMREWLLVFPGDSQDFLETFDKTITKNINKIDCGLWDQSRPIFIVLESLDNIESFIENPYFRRHFN